MFSTRPETVDPDALAFIAKARHDLSAAELLLVREDLADVVCFHAQQTAEKALKAALVAAGRQPLRTHDLPRLLDELVAADERWEEIRLMCEALSDFAVSPRYPEWELTAPDADPSEAVKNATLVFVFVLRTTGLA